MTNFKLAAKRVWVVGHQGMAWAAIAHRLSLEDSDLITAPQSELDLGRRPEVYAWMRDHQVDVVFLAVAHA